MSTVDATARVVEDDIWNWIHEFVTVPNAFYDHKFAPCPFAARAVAAKTVDVRVWVSGDVRQFIREQSIQMRESTELTTRVMVFPPRVRYQWDLNNYIEALNRELVASNTFLNMGVAKTAHSQYPDSSVNDPYFIVIANSLDAVLAGAEALEKTDYYKNWPSAHYEHVVGRRARLARKYGAP